MSIRHALLALLSEGPKYGLQLRQEFEARTGEVWPLERRPGVHDTPTPRAGRAGRVGRQRRARDRRRAFTSQRRARPSWTSGCAPRPTLSSPPRDELVIKVLVAIRLPGVDVHEVMQLHRRYLVELMQQWTRLKEDEARLDLNFALVVDAELFRLDSLIRWLDTVDGRLKRAAAGESTRRPRSRSPFPRPGARWESQR